MNETTRTKALSALDGMREIVRREMLVVGEYIEPEVSNPRLSNAICGGRKHCAIGSLWAGSGVKAERGEYGLLYLPGSTESERASFLRPRHGLRAAYDALNEAAKAFASRRGWDLSYSEFEAPIEALFEGHYENAEEPLTKRDLLSVIAAAKRQVKQA